MAQTNYTPIQIYSSSTGGATPSAGNLVNNSLGSELAINITDGKLFYKDNAGVVQVIGTKGGVGSSSNTQVLFNSSGAVTGAAGLTWDGTNFTASQVRSSGLTSGRVTFAGASGLLSDSTNLTWNGSTFAVTGTAAVTGAVTATADSSFTSTGALLISKGTTGQQPGSPATGMIRYNTTTNQFEGYSGSSPAWKSIGGSALSNDTSTSSNLYPVFAGATTGTAENLYTSNAKLLYKPSTGELSVSVPRASNGILVNTNTVAADYTIAATDNGLSAGPVSVNSGITVTVSSGAVWTVV